MVVNEILVSDSVTYAGNFNEYCKKELEKL